MTPPLMYYSACWVWLEYLTRGPEQAEQAMSDSLKAASQSRNEEMQGDAVLPGIVDESRKSHESSHIGEWLVNQLDALHAAPCAPKCRRRNGYLRVRDGRWSIEK